MKSNIYKAIAYGFSISAMLLITLAILSPHGITYYENNVYIKAIEGIMSTLSICYLIYDYRRTK